MRLAVRNVGTNYLAYGAAILSGLILTPVTIGATSAPVWQFDRNA